MLRVRPRRLRLPEARALGGIVLTSGQAADALAAAAFADPAFAALPVFAVGDSTAARVLAAGFSACESAAGDAAALATLVRARLPAGATLLLATGAGQGAALSHTLRAAGFRVHRRVAYAARPIAALPGPALAALGAGRIAACLFFSAESARNFARLLPVDLRPSLGSVRALTISPAVGAVLATLPWRSVQAAGHPDAASLLALLRSVP